MKSRPAAQKACISPDPQGWTLQSGEVSVSLPTLEEVASKMPAALSVEALLPSSILVTEQFTLPKAPREELLAMAQIQLEKVLPYGVGEFVFDFEELNETEEGVEVYAIALAMTSLNQWAAPLRGAGMEISALGVYAVQLARSCLGAGVTLVVWLEQGAPYMLLASAGRLVWLDSLPNVQSEETDQMATHLSRCLLSAELSGSLHEGVSSAVCGALGWANAIREVLPEVPLDGRMPHAVEEVSGNWLPEAWSQESAQRARKANLFEKLQVLGLVYLALLVGGFLWLAVQKSQLGKLDQKIAELQPQVELCKARQSKWNLLGASIEPSRYMIEVLHQVTKVIGPADIRITEFQMGVREFNFSAEASSLGEAIEYVNRLKKEPELSSFKLDSPNPNLLPNERAQFRVTGKVDSQTVSKR
jgi:hypothetical protein